MWLFTKHGFYSIVRKKEGEFHIRARVKHDLENLKELAGISEKIITTLDADYRFRLVVGADQIVKVMERLGDGIDYSNFKGKVASDPDQREKLGAYHEIWGAMYGVQRRSEKD